MHIAFQYCAPYIIEEQSYIHSTDIWKDEYQKLSQSSADFVQFYRDHIDEYSVPNGWWFDGNAYLDVHGNRREIHPEVRIIAEAFSVEKNEDIRKRNRMLIEVEEWLH